MSWELQHKGISGLFHFSFDTFYLFSSDVFSKTIVSARGVTEPHPLKHEFAMYLIIEFDKFPPKTPIRRHFPGTESQKHRFFRKNSTSKRILQQNNNFFRVKIHCITEFVWTFCSAAFLIFMKYFTVYLHFNIPDIVHFFVALANFFPIQPFFFSLSIMLQSFNMFCISSSSDNVWIFQFKCKCLCEKSRYFPSILCWKVYGLLLTTLSSLNAITVAKFRCVFSP